MKNLKLFLVTLYLSALTLLGANRNYFSEDTFEEKSGKPIPKANAYFDGQKDKKMSAFSGWFNGPYALPSESRMHLENAGILPVLTYVGNFAANPSGGDKRGASVVSSVNLGIVFDLEKLTEIKALSGWSIGNTWVWRFGNSLTKDYIHNTFNVQQCFGGQTMHLQGLYALYNGDLAKGEFALTFKIGRFSAGDNFLSKPIYWMYQNNAIDGNPVGIFNQVNWSAYPTGTWAAFAQLDHDCGAYFKAGVYQINSDYQNSNQAHGLDFSFRKGIGVNANFEAGFDINHDESGSSPGNVSAGLAADWYSAPHNDDPSVNSHFNYTIYFQADYMVWNLGYPNRSESRYFKRTPDQAYRDLRGLILWGVVQYNPDENLAYMPFFASAGLLFNAPLTFRPDDAVCFGFAYGKYSDKLTTSERNSYEIMLELNYKFQVNRFFFLQPNMQYVINTKGGEYPNAFVLGLQFGANF